MLKRIFVLAISVFFIFQTSFSQEFMHSAGATISALYGKLKSPGETSSFALEQTNLTYFPRYNFIENSNSSVSIGLPVGAGIGIASNTYGGDAGISFAYDLAAALDYNMGYKSVSETENYFGGYFGIGFGYYHVSISGSEYSNFTGASYGPMIRGGVRIGSSNESWNGHGFSIGLFYKKGMEKDKLNTIGCSVLYEF